MPGVCAPNRGFASVGAPNLTPRFAARRRRAGDVNGRLVERHHSAGLAVGKAPATVNRGVEALRAAFRLAQKQDRLRHVPYFPMLREDNARQGFFEADEFLAVAEGLSLVTADAAWFAYRSGWRRGEVVQLRWGQVDRAAREVRLTTSKNGRPRSLPLAGPLWATLGRPRLRGGRRPRPRGSRLSPRRPTARRLRPRMELACVAAGLGQFVEINKRGAKLPEGKRRYVGRLLHDLRRTAARDMVRAGVPKTVAMAITGHRTRSMFDRYNITSEADKRAGLATRFARLPARSTEARG